MIASQVPRWHVAVRCSGRASLLNLSWDSLYLKLFGTARLEDGPTIYVSPDEHEEYANSFKDVAAGGIGPGGQVCAMLRRMSSGNWLIVLDDDIKKIRYRGKPVNAETLTGLLRQGMRTTGLLAFAAKPESAKSKWGSSPPGLFLREAELTGGLFALRVPPTMSGAEFADRVETRHGHIADDLERSLRVYNEGGGGSVGVFHELTVEKWHVPGLWKKGRGGVAALYPTADEFKQAKERHLDALCEEFPEIERVAISRPVDEKCQSGWRWGATRGW